MLFLDMAWLSHAHKLTPAADRAIQNSSADGVDDRQTSCVTKKLLAADGFILLLRVWPLRGLPWQMTPPPRTYRQERLGFVGLLKDMKLETLGDMRKAGGGVGQVDMITFHCIHV